MESTIYIIIQTKDCPCSITIQTFYLKDEKKKKKSQEFVTLKHTILKLRIVVEKCRISLIINAIN